MKFLLLALALATPAAHAAEVQKFHRTILMHWLNGPMDFGSPFMHARCNEAEQAQAQKAAEEAAKADCERAAGVNDCLVKSSRITVNGALDESVLARYGLKLRGDAYGYWGCEAEALVYGLQ